MGANTMQEKDSKYYKGTLAIPDTVWTVEAVGRLRFRKLGEITVRGTEVLAEMHSHRSIKGYEPVDIARRKAAKKWPYRALCVLEKE